MGDNILYIANNMAQYGSLLVKPFSTGMFMLFDQAMFDQLGGFHESALYAEDYLLSKKVASAGLGSSAGAFTPQTAVSATWDTSRFVGMFLKTMLNTFNDNYFLHDQGYWRQKV